MNKNNLLISLTGFLMAIADSVPGVSGGTIAYITGKYDELIDSISTITSKNTDKRKAGHFLLKLGLGWIIGFILAIIAITSLIETHIYELSSLFLGFVFFSIPFIIREEKSYIKNNYRYIIYTVISTAIVVIIVQLSKNNVVLSNNTSGIIKYAYIFLAGVIAISAMLLPGISGSSLLIIFGLYIPIISAIKEVLKLDFTNIGICIVFGLGVLFGIVFASKLIRHLLQKYTSQVIYTIIGLMIGSMYAIIIGPSTITNHDTKELLGYDTLNFNTFSFIFFALGIVSIIALNKLRTTRTN